MATIGQVVYNVQDYQHSGGYISTSNNSPTTTISSTSSNYDTNKFDIFSNIVPKFVSNGSFTKLGVNAPPGTRFILNTNKTILVGRSGIYELDEDIDITSLYFVRPYNYVEDEEATEEALNLGIAGFEAAEAARKSSLADLNARKSSLTDEEYWSEYVEIQEEYDAAYQVALAQFNMGVNGIYQLPYPDNLDDDRNFQDLYNVIIDFLY